MDTIKCNSAIEMILKESNIQLGKLFDSDVIFLKAGMDQPVDDVVKDEVEEMKSSPKKSEQKDKLSVVVETNGGYVETVERIVSVFRNHYQIVDYIVPNYAYSAGTILVPSGDDLLMNYYSVLGPIDPQIGLDDSDHNVPGMGYLAKFQELMDQINDPGKTTAETRAQLAYLLKRFDPAKLFTIEQAIEHSKSLLREWLPKYKFKTWTVKENSGIAVSETERQKRADEIATVLGDAKRWHSHGRGVGLKELQSEEIKLKVRNYGEETEINRHISNYYGLLIDFMQKNRYRSAIHTKRGIRRLA